MQTWNADLSHDLRQVWNVGAGYTRHARLEPRHRPRAEPRPDRPAHRRRAAVPLADVGRHRRCCTPATFRLQPPPGERASAAASPTRSPSRATTPRRSAAAARSSRRTIRISAPSGGSRASIGGISSTADISVELPFGPNRRWLHSGGRLGGAAARLARSRRRSRWQSGTPLTPRVTGVGERRRARHQRHAARRLQRRADRSSPIRRSISSSTPRRSRVPPPGTFGNASRNMIIGPGSRQLNAQFSRDVRMGGNRALTLQLNAHQPAQHGQLRRRRHGRQLADVRPGPVGRGRCGRCSSICGSGSEVRAVSVRLSAQVPTELTVAAAAGSSSVRPDALCRRLVRSRWCHRPSAQQPPPQPRPPAPGAVRRRPASSARAAKSSRSTSSSATSRGAVVRGLTAADFEVREDGQPQEVLSFSFEEIKDKAPAPGRDGRPARRRRSEARRSRRAHRRRPSPRRRQPRRRR